MLEVIPTGSDRNGNDAVAGAALEAFGRWQHRRYAPIIECIYACSFLPVSFSSMTECHFLTRQVQDQSSFKIKTSYEHPRRHTNTRTTDQSHQPDH